MDIQHFPRRKEILFYHRTMDKTCEKGRSLKVNKITRKLVLRIKNRSLKFCERIMRKDGLDKLTLTGLTENKRNSAYGNLST